jgi:hypothetical protein
MVISTLFLAAGVAFAGSHKAEVRHSEETLRVMLLNLRQSHAAQVRDTVLGAGEELRDSVTAGAGVDKHRLVARLPGMAKDPFNICRDLEGCREAPLSLHVEDFTLIDDAFVALARPWFKLQQARGKAVAVSVDPGSGVQLKLEGLRKQPVVTLTASPTPTGGFDVALEEGTEAAATYAAERAAVLIVADPG